MLETIRPFLQQYITCAGSSTIISILLLVGISVASLLVYYITKGLLSLLEKVILRSPTDWDDDLFDTRLFNALAQLSPALCVWWLIPGLFGDTAVAFRWLSAITSLYIVWVFVRVAVIFLGNLYGAIESRAHLKVYAIKGVFEMLKLVVICLGAIIGLSILIGKSPVVIITALGASAAVLMLIFQDTILGFVASIQLTANEMLHPGDWIEDKSHNVDGEVIEVSLTTVKVKNWDNSVSTLPPYALIKGSFRNYQAMRRSGGRRVKRPIFIDINTVRFCSLEEVKALDSKSLLEGVELPDPTRVVNLQLFRLYLSNYLREHPMINHKMTTIVRQLDATNAGIPLEIYFFVADVDWVAYEGKAADVFDHIYAVVHEFGLSIFQQPAGLDLARIAK